MEGCPSSCGSLLYSLEMTSPVPTSVPDPFCSDFPHVRAFPPLGSFQPASGRTGCCQGGKKRELPACSASLRPWEGGFLSAQFSSLGNSQVFLRGYFGSDQSLLYDCWTLGTHPVRQKTALSMSLVWQEVLLASTRMINLTFSEVWKSPPHS